MYGICRTLKMKVATDISASENHCARIEGRETHKRDADIRPELSKYNVSMTQGWVKDDGSMMTLNEQIECVMKEENIIAPRKDSVKVVEYMLTLSPEFFEGCDITKGLEDEKIKAFLDGTTHFLNKEPNTRVINWHLHLDEKSPHLHAHVMITDVNKKNQQILNVGKVLDGRAKLSLLQDRYFDIMKQYVPGLKRGVSSDLTERKHLTLKEIGKALRGLEKVGISPDKIERLAGEIVRDQVKEARTDQEEISESIKEKLTEALKDKPIDVEELFLKHERLKEMTKKFYDKTYSAFRKKDATEIAWLEGWCDWKEQNEVKKLSEEKRKQDQKTNITIIKKEDKNRGIPM
jgi:Plasmid recombination enzyme